jgi:hypothetical protein
LDNNIIEDKNQARRERDRARIKSLTTEQKENINARRRAKRNSLSVEQKNKINGHRRLVEQRTSTQRLTEEKRAKRRANAAARRNTPCPESIAMPCPKINLGSSTRGSPAKEGTSSPPVSPSSSTPEYTIGTNGNTQIFTPFIYAMAIKPSFVPDLEFPYCCTYQTDNGVGDMDAFLSGIMDENAIPDDLMDEEYCMYAREGTYAILSIVCYESI